MDIDEIRSAFTLSSEIAERIMNFRLERISRIYSDETPVKIDQGVKVILHLIPLSAFASDIQFDVVRLCRNEELVFRPIGEIHYHPGAYNYSPKARINLDGFVWFDGSETYNPTCYAQVFRSGIIESVKVLDEKEGKIRCDLYERDIVEILPYYLERLNKLGITIPLYLFLTFIGMKEKTLSYYVPQPNKPNKGKPIDRDIIQLPEQVIDSFDNDIIELLRPLLYQMCNASGFLRSRNFNEKNEWIGT